MNCERKSFPQKRRLNNFYRWVCSSDSSLQCSRFFGIHPRGFQYTLRAIYRDMRGQHHGQLEAQLSFDSSASESFGRSLMKFFSSSLCIERNSCVLEFVSTRCALFSFDTYCLHSNSKRIVVHSMYVPRYIRVVFVRQWTHALPTKRAKPNQPKLVFQVDFEKVYL